LDASGVSDLGPSGVTTHVNKVHHVTAITRVAEELGEDEDWLRDVANEMEIEDGVIWVYGVGQDGVLAFTDFGIDGSWQRLCAGLDAPSGKRLEAARIAGCATTRSCPVYCVA
jgi:hypothetical protein